LGNERSLLFFHSQLNQASILRFEGSHARVSIYILTLLAAQISVGAFIAKMKCPTYPLALDRHRCAQASRSKGGLRSP
ncbi:hypothetical protein, partial [Sphingobium sp. YR657]|uniref:hypothetical protein n=1 Tax=Sphingobium sp. YR657 TaxID=1884366 RepID=UPI001C31B599